MTLHFDQRLLLLMPPYDTIIKITGALKLTNSSSENQLISLTFFLLQMSQYNTIAKINLLNQLVQKSTKKVFAQGKIKRKKNSCTPINPKRYSCFGLKKIHAKNLITKKNFFSSKIPLPRPITFLMVRP